MCVSLTLANSARRVVSTAARIALNEATESVVARTLHDKIYFQHELETAMKRELNKNKISLALYTVR